MVWYFVWIEAERFRLFMQLLNNIIEMRSNTKQRSLCKLEPFQQIFIDSSVGHQHNSVLLVVWNEDGDVGLEGHFSVGFIEVEFKVEGHHC